MIGLVNLEVYNSVFNINTTYNKFEFHTDNFDKFSFGELKDELEEIKSTSDITQYRQQHETKGPLDFKAYKKLRLEKSSTDGYIILLIGYARSPLRDFESYLRVVVGLDKDDIRLILKQKNLNFDTYELNLRIYTIRDISETVYTMRDHQGTLQTEYDDIGMKIKPILTRFGGTIGTLRFDERNTLLGFRPCWDYKPTIAIRADSPGVNTADKILNLNTIDIFFEMRCYRW